MDIIHDLSGGFYKKIKTNENIETNKEQSEDSDNEETYSVYFQFDDDQPVRLFGDINIEDAIQFEIGLGFEEDEETGEIIEDSSVMEFTCPKTNKKFKIYAK